MTPNRDAQARPARRCPGWAVAVHLVCAAATAVAAQESVSQYARPEPFLAAIEAERPAAPRPVKLTGIAVPHHLLDLIARGFWAAAAGSYDRIMVLSPDHFNRTPSTGGFASQPWYSAATPWFDGYARMAPA